MEILVDAGPEAVARRAAGFIAAEARAAAKERGRFVLAVSGGRTPGLMLRALAEESVPWEAVQIVQVDERVAPEGHRDRNLTELRGALVGRTLLRAEQIHAMPVEVRDLSAATRGYAETLVGLSGMPPVLDLVHLGLGADGHTASLVPRDPVLDVVDADVAMTGEYQGRRRMTLCYPVLNRARRVLWLVTGSEKSGALRQLMEGDHSIPAGGVSQQRALVMADQAASATLNS